jgi:hypothetical protein
MKQYFTRIRKSLQRLAVSHVVPAGSRKVTVALKIISKGSTLFYGAEHN